MNELTMTDHGDPVLTAEVLAHLDAQLKSARRLLQVVLEQGAAIRARDVHAVVQLTGILQAELHKRAHIERKRAELLELAGAKLGIAAGSVTLTLLERLIDPELTELAEVRSAELRGLLEEVQREHYVNRALMTQELAFLDHLLKLTDQDGGNCYDAVGDVGVGAPPAAVGQRRVLDMEV
jgi:hypothetical protein